MKIIKSHLKTFLVGACLGWLIGFAVSLFTQEPVDQAKVGIYE